MERKVNIRFIVLRNYAQYSELIPINAPTLRMDSSGEVKMSLTGDFEANPAVNWLTDEIQPVIEIDGNAEPLGVVIPATVRENEDETTKSVYVEAYDRCWYVRDSLVETRPYFAYGTNYVDAIKQLLLQAGITLVQAESTTKRMIAREDWDIGTSRLDIINQLLGEINYNELWFNSQGVAIIAPAKKGTAEDINHVIDSGDIKSLMLPGISAEMDVYNAPNVFICICSNADRTAPIIAKAENTNPQSPLSIQRRGRRIVSVEYVENTPLDNETLNDYAARKRNESMLVGQTIQLETALFPGYGAYDFTAVVGHGVDAVCKERAWEMELRTGGTMKHTLEKVVYAFE